MFNKNGNLYFNLLLVRLRFPFFLVISKKKVKFGEINEIDRNLNSNWKLEKFQMQSFSQRLNQPTNQLTNRLTACKD